jgi:Ca-activated chloride channel family protein
MTFEAPIWLVIAPILVAGLTLFFVITEISRQKNISRFTGSKMVTSLANSYSRTKRNTKAILFTLSAGFCCLALARPQLGSTYIEEQRKGVDFIIALDVSKSMLAEDIKPNRLERAKLSILDLLEKIKGDRVGLVAFAGSAFLQCPLTLDYDAFRQTLDSVNTEILSTQGTDIAGALLEAEASFAKDNNHKVLVMMTDGEDLEAEGILQAKKMKEAGMTIYTIGVGMTEGELIPVKDDTGKYDWLKDPGGNLVRTKLDEQTLKEIAVASDGIYVPLGPTGEGLMLIYEHCLAAIPDQERETRLQQVPIERYQWPLALAIGCWIIQSLIGSRRHE